MAEQKLLNDARLASTGFCGIITKRNRNKKYAAILDFQVPLCVSYIWYLNYINVI